MAITVEINGKTYTFRNLEEQVLFLTKELTKVQQSLGNALPDPIPGPQGEPGATGGPGPEGPRGTGIFGCTAALPSPTAYKEGDLYVLFSGDLYRKINGEWVLQTNIKGPQGAPGLEGGTEVVANPVGSSTDNLEKINIDGTIYEVITTVDRNKLGLISYVGTSWFLTSRINIASNTTILASISIDNFGTFDCTYGGNIKLSLLSQIVDSSNNPIVICENLTDENNKPRFVEGDIDVTPVTGVTISYKKWSLSGSHLMVVVGGTIVSGSTFSMYAVCQNLPVWIANKIVPLANENVRLSSTKAYGTDLSSQDISMYLQKTGTVISIYCPSELITADRNFCIQFDLLIDMA